MHFKTITKLLNLPNIIVVDALELGDDHLHLVVALSDNADPPVCSWCGAVHTSVHSKGQMRVEDFTKPCFSKSSLQPSTNSGKRRMPNLLTAANKKISSTLNCDANGRMRPACFSDVQKLILASDTILS